jgi:hypothetical protein
VSCGDIHFDETFALPKDTLFAFPTMNFLNDPDTFSNADEFDYLRFYNMKEESVITEASSPLGK